MRDMIAASHTYFKPRPLTFTVGDGDVAKFCSVLAKLSSGIAAFAVT